MKRSDFTEPVRAWTVVVAAALIAGCGTPPDPKLAPPISVKEGDSQLTWGNAGQVPGTAVMRINLVRMRSGYSSGYAEIRNVLFLDPAEKAGRWLLPDSRHYFDDHRELATDPEDPKAKCLLATVALVKDVSAASAEAPGRLIIFDPVGRTALPLADDVRRLNVASLAPSGEFVILYERNRQFVSAVVDRNTLKTLREQVFDIPPLG